MRQNLIYPELMREGKWRIDFNNEKTHGRTSTDEHWMSIPKGNSPLEKFVRMHELSHAKWSGDFQDIIARYPEMFEMRYDADGKGETVLKSEYQDTFQVAEDGRINYLMRRKGITGIAKGSTEFYESQTDLTNLKRTLYLGVITQAFLPEFFRPILQKLRKENPKLAAIIRRARKLYIKHGDEFDKSTIPIIKLITEAKKQEEQQQEQQGKQGDSNNDAAGMIVCSHESKNRERLEQKIKEAQKKDVQEQEQKKEKIEAAQTQKHQQEFKELGINTEYLRKQAQEDEDLKRATWSWRKDGDNVNWGELKIETVPLIKLISKKPAVRHRFADTGLRVRQIHRDDIDGMVFVESHRNFRIGSLLIDCSGSMSISVQEIERIVLQCPGMIIAIYAAEIGYGGILRIVAKNGKMCSLENLNLYLGNNLVDLPALQWLAKQQKPRFWVSDGNVTGIIKNSFSPRIGISEEIAKEAFNFIKTNQILRVTNLSQLEAHCLKYRM